MHPWILYQRLWKDRWLILQESRPNAPLIFQENQGGASSFGWGSAITINSFGVTFLR